MRIWILADHFNFEPLMMQFQIWYSSNDFDIFLYIMREIVISYQHLIMNVILNFWNILCFIQLDIKDLRQFYFFGSILFLYHSALFYLCQLLNDNKMKNFIAYRFLLILLFIFLLIERKSPLTCIFIQINETYCIQIFYKALFFLKMIDAIVFVFLW